MKPNLVPLPLACAALLFAGCSAEDPAAAECTDIECLEAYDSVTDGKFDADGVDVNDSIAELIKARYGVRPRRYNGFFNDSNWGEERFRAALPQVTEHVNSVLEERGIAPPLSTVGVAVNFITEGGYYALDLEGLRRTVAESDPAAAEGIPTWNELEAAGEDPAFDGFTFFGVDTLVDNFPSLRPFMPQELVDLVDSGSCDATSTNERGEMVTSLDCLTLELGMFANAGMLAWAHERAADALADAGTPMSSLPEEGQFFWSTVFFNAGPGTGQRQLNANGAAYYEERWNESDDHLTWARSPKYNASWRTASYEFMRDTVFAPQDLPGEAVCRFADTLELGDTAEEATLMETVADVGTGTLLGYFPGDDTDDWIAIDVTETSRSLGMCASAEIVYLPDDYDLCVRYDRVDGSFEEACSNMPGTEDDRVSLDLERFARDDSGRMLVHVSRGVSGPGVCDGYTLTWSVMVGKCAR